MTPAEGQAAPAGRSRWSRLAGLVLGTPAVAAGLVLVVSFVLVVRLAHGPMQVTGLVRRFAARPLPGTHLSIGAARLFWDRDRSQSPLLLDLDAPVLTRADGSVVARLAHARIGVLPARLLVGRMRPILLAGDGGSIALHLSASGDVALDTGQPPAARARTPDRTLRRLRDVDLSAIDITLSDSAQRHWQARLATLHATGLDGVSPTGTADLQGAFGTSRPRLQATLAAGPVVRTRISSLVPSQLPALPALAMLRGAALPVTADLQASLTPQWQPVTVAATITTGAGSVTSGGSTLAITTATGHIQADLAARRATLTSLRIVLTPPAADEAGQAVTAHGTAAWRDTANGEAGLSVELDRVPAAALGRYWPAGVAASARAWLVANATAGSYENAHFDLGIVDRAGALGVSTATGHLQAQDLTVAWLAPAPPLVHAQATLTLLSPDALSIAVTQAQQAPSDRALPLIAIGNATMRITGLTAQDQLAAIDATLVGPVGQAIALLREPRLKLLSRHPINVGTPTGTLRARITVNLPLISRVDMDAVRLHAAGQLSALHLGGVLAGRDLDRGELALDATNDGLTLAGPATLAGLPSQLSVAMDFRSVPVGTVQTTYAAHGAGTMQQLVQAGLPDHLIAEGSVGYSVRVQERSGGRGDIQVHVDLTAAALNLGVAGLRKGKDAAGSVDASLLLDHDRVVGADHLSVVAPGIVVQGHAAYLAGKPVALQFDRIELGRTRATGQVRFASAADPAIHASLRGPVLDLSALLASDAGARPTATPSRSQARAAAAARRTAPVRAGPAWFADLAFDQVLLGHGRTVSGVAARADSDGRTIRHARLTATAGSAELAATITPAGGTARLLHATASDAGALLAAADVSGAIDGGTLTLDGRYDDTQPDHPLDGTLQIDRFRVTKAPGVARLLQAMTLYGVVDVLKGPGLGITHLVAPFRYASQVLSLHGARAFSGSLGFTAKGDIDLAAQRADLSGTIVPAYFFNTLLGRLPILGKLFSPEKGGGLLAATYTLTGSLADPAVHVNPLAALTPGFLRGLFGVFDGSQK